MAVYSLDGILPEIDGSAWLAPTATVIGRVRLGAEVGIWFGAVLRGDTEPITVGARTNVQEHVIMHTDAGFPLDVAEGCTIGHKALLHGCAIGGGSLVGMGAIVLNGARIGRECLVGAGALVTEGKSFPDRSLILGVPARLVRALSDEAVASLHASAAHYAGNAARFREGLRIV